MPRSRALASTPNVQELIRAEIDRRLAEAHSAGDAPLRAARKERSTAEAERQRLADAIARGILSDGEAVEKMDEIRARLSRAEAEIARAERDRDSAVTLAEERERLMKLTADFPARAATASGAQLRALLQPWIESATFDKNTRRINLVLRRIPDSGLTGGERVHSEAQMPSVGRDAQGRWQTTLAPPPSR